MNLFLFLHFLQGELLPLGIGAGLKDVVSIVVILIFLGFILRVLYKLLPTWKEIKLAELGVRGKEAEAQVQVANALGGLGTALNQIGTTLENVAIEQRRATDNIKILQRATADENGNIQRSVDDLMERMDSFEEKLKEQTNETRPQGN